MTLDVVIEVACARSAERAQQHAVAAASSISDRAYADAVCAASVATVGVELMAADEQNAFLQRQRHGWARLLHSTLAELREARLELTQQEGIRDTLVQQQQAVAAELDVDPESLDREAEAGARDELPRSVLDLAPFQLEDVS